jgi:two-component system chemotaxis sensor kinase CheA
MGDGKVALILDVLGIAQRSGVVAETRESARAEAVVAGERHSERQTLLLFRSAGFQRLAVPLSLVARLEEFARPKIEHAAGRQVVQYRGKILPLVSLNTVLEPGAPDTASQQDPAQVIVFSDGDRRMGLLVDQIVDIVEDLVTVKMSTSRGGLLGSAVIGDKVTDFLDLHAVIQATDETWFGGGGAAHAEAGARVLVAEGSSFSRGMLRNYLEMAGHRVLEAASTAEAIEKLGRERVDVVMASLDLPGTGFDLLERIRKLPGLGSLPVLALANRAEETETPIARSHDFEDYQMKFDREAMLRSIEKLAAAVNPAAGTSPGGGNNMKPLPARPEVTTV